MQRRYVHGANPGVDDPIAWFSSSSFTAAATRHLFANQQGSVVLSGDSAGNALRIFAYDEYGVPTTAGGAAQLTAANGARFGFTGQAWIPELGMYHYKARIYSPTLGRFMQTDPIGYDDQINLYAYVGNDPVNKSDPTGMACAASGDRGISNCSPPPPPPPQEIVVTAEKAGEGSKGRRGTSLGGIRHLDSRPRQDLPGTGPMDGVGAVLTAFHDYVATLSDSRVAKILLKANGRIVAPLGWALRYADLKAKGFSDKAALAGVAAGFVVEVNSTGAGAAAGAAAGTVIEPGGGSLVGGIAGGLAGAGADIVMGWSDTAALRAARQVDGR